MTNREEQAWMLLAYGDDRQYKGNTGYSETLSSEYLYDQFVQNHKQIQVGDIVAIRNRTKLLGVAVIQDIFVSQGLKDRLRCPLCQTVKIKQRKNGSFRCQNNHEFMEPKRESVSCNQYTATFGDSFISMDNAIPVETLRGLCKKPSDQLAMQRLDFLRFTNTLREANVEVPIIKKVSERKSTPTRRNTFTFRSFDSSCPPVFPQINAVDTVAGIALREKASIEHHDLLKNLFGFLIEQGWTDIFEIPGAIDLLSTDTQGKRTLFEAKTITTANEIHQVRSGFSQLCEYRYFFGMPSDALCLVTDAPIHNDRVKFLHHHQIGIWYKTSSKNFKSISMNQPE